MDPLPCRCGCAHAGHRRRGNASMLRGACLTPGCGCPDYFGAPPVPDRFPVTIRKDPTVVREYGDRAPLTHSPFAAVDALQKLAHAASTELAMTGAAYVQLDEDEHPIAVLCGRGNGKTTALEQLDRETVLPHGMPGYVDPVTGPQPVEDWRVWYCLGCRFAGQPDDHVDCEHVIVPGRLKLFLDV